MITTFTGIPIIVADTMIHITMIIFVHTMENNFSIIRRTVAQDHKPIKETTETYRWVFQQTQTKLFNRNLRMLSRQTIQCLTYMRYAPRNTKMKN